MCPRKQDRAMCSYSRQTPTTNARCMSTAMYSVFVQNGCGNHFRSGVNSDLHAFNLRAKHTGNGCKNYSVLCLMNGKMIAQRKGYGALSVSTKNWQDDLSQMIFLSDARKMLIYMWCSKWPFVHLDCPVCKSSHSAEGANICNCLGGGG